MKRTISVMLGKGSVRHNSRKFQAANVDEERTPLNQTYCDTPIKQVYHDLFDEALKKYNEKQTRRDRQIDDYYEKICTGKQERLFHEVVLQIGNCENMNAITEDGQLAAKILDEYVQEFQKRNPNLHVFSAHLHMDEATPHLHIDFVPFTTGSKRGLDTRVSLKQALAAQGFTGGLRGATEWSQWVQSEKEHLAEIMQHHGIEWEQLGTHNQHLSVMDYKKEQREKEVQALDENISDRQKALIQLEKQSETKKIQIDKYSDALDSTKNKLQEVKTKERFIADNARTYDNDPEFQLPEPKPIMSARAYHTKVALPLVQRLKDTIRSILLQYYDKTKELNRLLDRANNKADGLSKELNKYRNENAQLREVGQDFSRVSGYLGVEKTREIIENIKALEHVQKQNKRKHEQVR